MTHLSRICFWGFFCLQNAPICHTENTAFHRRNGRKLWIWQGGGIQSGLLVLMGKWRLLATGKGISLPLNKAVLCSWRKLGNMDKPFCWLHVKMFSSEIQRMLWQSVLLPIPYLEKRGHLDFKMTVSSHLLAQQRKTMHGFFVLRKPLYPCFMSCCKEW